MSCLLRVFFLPIPITRPLHSDHVVGSPTWIRNEQKEAKGPETTSSTKEKFAIGGMELTAWVSVFSFPSLF